MGMARGGACTGRPGQEHLGADVRTMLRWARARKFPWGTLGPSSTRCFPVPSALSGGSGGDRAEDNPRPVPLSYNLLDGKATLPAIVFLHGLFGSKTNFTSIAKAMAQRTGRRVLTVDARNHGDSPHSPDPSYEAMSQDLQDLLPKLGLVPCVLVGHSMGGKTAMLLALQRPEVVDRLVAVDISPAVTTTVSNFGQYMSAMKSVDIPEKMPRSRARKLADEQLSSAIQDPIVRQFLLTNLVEIDGHFSWRVNLDTLAQHLDKIMNFPRRLESYSGPTLFLLGEKSRFVLPSHHPEIRRLFPRAQMQTVPNAAHWVHSDNPQDFMDAIEGFLA